MWVRGSKEVSAALRIYVAPDAFSGGELTGVFDREPRAAVPKTGNKLVQAFAEIGLLLLALDPNLIGNFEIIVKQSVATYFALPAIRVASDASGFEARQPPGVNI